jgi:tetratricopeptide (TPR) repeat protein
MNRNSKVAYAACAVVIVTHIFGNATPTHPTWGVHLFAFFPPGVGWAALLFSVALLFPSVNNAVCGAFDALVKKLSKLPAIVVNAALVGLLAFLGVRFAAELHLLGDSAILMRSIPISSWGDEVLSSFKNQPLLNVVYRWAMNLATSDATVHPREVYVTINLVAGALMVLIVGWFTKALQRPPLERVLAGLFLFGAAGTQFFFGYVENYVLQYVATIAYAITGWLALERRVHVLVPLAILAVLPGFNLGTLILVPSGLFLFFYRYDIGRWMGLLLLAGLSVAGVGILFAAGFDFSGFIGKFTGKAVDFLPLFGSVAGKFPYAMFSLNHLIDWLNAGALVVPFGLLIPAAFIPLLPKEERRKPAFLFLLVLAGLGLLFTWIINSALGMARDWDMLSSYFVPLAVLSVYLLVRAPGLEPRRSVLVAVTLISLVHTAAFIGVNADAARHLARMTLLGDERFLSNASQIWRDEALANFFFDNKYYADARVYYEHYMTIDSTNTRIVGNISDVYRKLGEKDKYFYQLQRGVKLGSPNPGMYANLGVEFSGRGDTAQAIYWNAKAVGIDSMHTSANANLGILYMGRKEYARANFHFGKAIAAGMREPKLFLYAAQCAMLSKQYVTAVRYYDFYLERNPGDQKSRQQRDRISTMLKESGVLPP